MNLHEQAQWSSDGRAASPKMAALLAMAELPEPDPVPSVEYRSGGRVLITGPADTALAWGERLPGGLQPSVLITRQRSREQPAARGYPVWFGQDVKIVGWLGAFQVEWTSCDAIALSPAESARRDTFDLVLDLSPEPLLRMPDLPPGYFAPGADPLRQALAAARLPGLVGEFEKPKFFRYKERICAHSRSGISGCTRCIDVCSTGAIRADGDHVKVEPHLCAGCGGCATVCPSGAMAYAYPSVPDVGRRLKALLRAYREAGGKDACIVFHDPERGAGLLQDLPARAIPLECFHIASIGLDTLLGAVCYGASQVVIVGTDEPAGYAAALREQMAFGETILQALGYGGVHFVLILASAPQELETRLRKLQPAVTVDKIAGFNLSAEKRTTLDFAFDHLSKHNPLEQIPLPAGAPFGAIVVDKQSCTLCKACIGACPEAALLDSPETPALRFIENNCVQCGLCAVTCPEDAITLVPRLLCGAQAKQPAMLNEAQPFHCVRCAKPFGTRQIVDNMLPKLGGHSMFAATGSLRRLRMCGDCRVVDMVENKTEATIFDYPK